VYGTTPRFLDFFGLRNLTELPTLREFSELAQENFVRMQGYEETLQANEAELLQPDENQLFIPFAGEVLAGDDNRSGDGTPAPEQEEDDAGKTPEIS
jgi:hypothetical protein